MREKSGQTTLDIDIDALAKDLRRNVDGEVRFDTAARALYVSDASNYRQVPIGVVLPRTTGAVVRAIEVCHQYGAPIVSRGAGTGLCGQACNVAVVIDHSKYLHRVLEIDPLQRLARVQPGTVLDHLREEATKNHQLTFGPDPATHSRCTLGGMIGNNSCGIHSAMAGRTSDNVHELDIVTYDGVRMKVGKTDDTELNRIMAEGGRKADIYLRLRNLRDRYADLIRERFPKVPGSVAGYALDQLLPENGFNLARALVGTESTCVTVLEATLHLIPDPAVRSLLVLGYPDIYRAADHILEVMQHRPIGCEGVDDQLVRFMNKGSPNVDYAGLLPEGSGWLIVEFGGRTRGESDGSARRLMDALKRSGRPPVMKLLESRNDEEKIWQIRESGLGATANVPGLPIFWPGWEDAAVPPDRLGDYLREFRALLDEFGLIASLFGHFAQGCIHSRISFDLFSREGVANYMSFIERASDLVLTYRGSFSAEHGDGQSRAIFLPKMYGKELMPAFREFKAIWDPEWKMNPGKVIDPYRPDENLRLGPDYRPWEAATRFKFPDDKGSFAKATLRCVGVGKCREPHRAFMCPSFQATREEMHTTRGRAHLLFEMFRGDLIKDGWKSRDVRKALELCLGCKGCKRECPVGVDLAAYRSEFFSHYYSGRFRPRSHYALGLIGYWGPLAAKVPRLANFLTQTAGIRTLTKIAGGYALKRTAPRFSPETFTAVFRRQQKKGRPGSGEKIALVPDLYNDCFFPDALGKADFILRRWGFDVVLPDPLPREVRPLLHYGMLALSRPELARAVRILGGYASTGIPLVFLEPSAVSVYRDELMQLFPDDHDAISISKHSYLLSEFIEERKLDLPRLEGKAVFHAHCHEKAVLNPEAARSLLRRMGLELEEPQPGCCGMAGSFGLERAHYDISLKISEENLLPAVREAHRSTYIVAEGFSCRSQIFERTERKPLHLSELLYAAFESVGSAYEAEHLKQKPEEKEYETRKAA